jgi:tRNA 2-selenouridine synthase
MRLGSIYQVTADMSQRVMLWREDYRHFEADPLAMMARLRYLKPLVGSNEFEVWEDLAQEAKMPDLFERLMSSHYDPAYCRSMTRNYPDIASAPVIHLTDLAPAALLAVARTISSN